MGRAALGPVRSGQAPAQVLREPAADIQLAPVAEDDDGVAASTSFESGDAVQVDERRSVDLHDAIGSWPRAESIQCSAHEVRLRTDVKPQVVAGRLHPIDFARFEDDDSV